MEKAQRIDRVENTLTREELLRRLPEIDLIMEDELRERTINTFLLGCPDYFWELPTSSTGKYHDVDERGKHGNWIHTKRVFITYLVVSRTYLTQHRIDEFQREAGKSAALVHDMLKYGWPSEQNAHTTTDHDIIGADVAKYLGELPRESWSAIHAHNGGWAEGKNPEFDFEDALHLSDYVASKPVLGTPAIWNPADEILEEFPNIKMITDDELQGYL